VAPAGLDDKPAVLERRRAQDDPANAQAEVGVHRGKVPDTAPQLDGHVDGGQDATNDGVVDGAPLAGAVEIDDVDPLGSRTGPSARHLHGIAAVDGLALEIPLEEPYAPAAADVNGWNDDQGMRLRNREPGSDS